MRILVTGRQMKAIDAYTIDTVGIPSMVLMERAALAVAETVKKQLTGDGGVWAVCGTGNNGADGIAAARLLWLAGRKACVVLLGQPEKGSEEFLHQLKIARNLGMEIMNWQDFAQASIGWEPGDRTVLDAVFGVGLSRNVEGLYKTCLEELARRRAAGIVSRIVAVDLPSGIHSDQGCIMGAALKADMTVTFGWEKLGTVLYPGREYAGEVRVEDIGFPASALKACAKAAEEEGQSGELLTACTYDSRDLARIPRRAPDSNKGTFGKVLIAAGSRNMCGAAYLSALAAYRTGAGLVKLLTVEENRQILQSRLPEAILATYTPRQLMEGREEFQKMIDEQCRWADVVVLGPGLGAEGYVEYLVEDILTMACSPVVVDADGLNTIAAHPYLTTYFTENIIVTPHLGEMARLTGQSITQIREDLAETAIEYASRYGLTCVLKDAATVAASRDGEVYINTSGCAAMAKAGAGDVLTGIIAGLLAQGLDENQSARLGVYLHGRAGQLAARDKGAHSLLASDLAEYVGAAMDTGDERK